MPVALRANANFRAEAKYNVVTEFTNYNLHSAAASGNQGLVEYALGRGQPVNSVLDGVLPLHAACAGGDEQVVKLLIDHGADVNAPRLPRRFSNDKNRDTSVPIVGTTGSTPLHFAAANGNKNVIMALLLRGAHADRRDKHGITPAMLAEQNRWLECAQVLNDWVENKDKDLREREGAVGQEEGDRSFGYEEDTSGSTRKRIQMKRSIDTALNMFKPSSSLSNMHSQSRQHLSASTNNLNTVSPPTSPTRSRGDFSPSPSEDGRFSPSPSPIDPGSRRPSLPQVLQTSYSTPSSRKPATLTKPRTPRRPRSAGTDAERPDGDISISSTTGRGSAGKKLGTKYSLMNLFKKGQTGESSGGSVPLERTMSQQTTGSFFMSPYTSRFPQNNSFINDSGPLPKPGYRFGSSGTLSSSPSQSSQLLSQARASPSASSVNQVQPSSPSRTNIPLAVDLHNAMASQQYQQMHRGRSGSSGSSTLPEGSAPIPIPLASNPTYDEGVSPSSSGPQSTSPVTRKIARLAQAGHSRDRSGSGASLNRNAAVFDDEVVMSSDQSLPGSRASSRPGILRGHNRTSSTGQSSGLRALRFDSASSGASRTTDTTPPLRGCTSAGSLNRFRHRERRGSSRSPSRMRPPEVSTPEMPETPPPGHSAPAAVTDFDIQPRNPEGEDDDDAYFYGRPIPIEQSTLAASHLPNSRNRHRGESFTSSASSLSPSLSTTDPVAIATDTLNTDFPFSITRPPPIPLEDSEGSSSYLQVPAPTHVDNRLRGDSISSNSTADSVRNPDLSVSDTTSGSGGSIHVTTPLATLEELSSLTDADTNGLRPEDGVGAASINERRSHSPLRQINLDLVQSHAQAEALVQQKKQDILSAHNDGTRPNIVGHTPLSARLAALGESLQLEKELREKKEKQLEKKNADGLARRPSETSPSPAGVDRPRRNQESRKPQTSGETSTVSPNNSVDSTPKVSVERARPTHHSSLSASAVEYSPTLDTDYDSPVISNSRSFNEATYIRPLRARTPDPALTISRVSSLDGLHDGHDTDTELGPALCRISTAPHSAPHSAPKAQRELSQASYTKLARMGFAVSDLSAGRTPPPKRFGGLRSLVQKTLKGRQ
ncbi:hypothetical protein K435DRAFT_761244 [Dendrothele bispora CBS 962.96]|uniref:Uncharacterized protein n=1 Tax=Dendrothele bispora (strain CBS 962.96) TaxID=1314807 RepID=A0A4V4HE24_DENBC|nr:hypothetical protein K435DRAFT_761244 [Dendrothele bispora CBS 962.96]